MQHRERLVERRLRAVAASRSWQVALRDIVFAERCLARLTDADGENEGDKHLERQSCTLDNRSNKSRPRRWHCLAGRSLSTDRHFVDKLMRLSLWHVAEA